jgi:uncharacterized membrane protein (DUF2068 family)
VETRRFVNPTQPQTLYIATFLLYFSAVFGILGGSWLFAVIGAPALLVYVGQAGAGYGIANEKRWGYWLGVVTAALALLPFAVIVIAEGLAVLFQFAVLFSLVFPVALFLLLVHPMSREYQRLWFS